MDFRDRRAASGCAVGEGQIRITSAEDRIVASSLFLLRSSSCTHPHQKLRLGLVLLRLGFPFFGFALGLRHAHRGHLREKCGAQQRRYKCRRAGFRGKTLCECQEQQEGEAVKLRAQDEAGGQLWGRWRCR